MKRKRNVESDIQNLTIDQAKQALFHLSDRYSTEIGAWLDNRTTSHISRLFPLLLSHCMSFLPWRHVLFMARVSKLFCAATKQKTSIACVDHVVESIWNRLAHYRISELSFHATDEHLSLPASFPMTPHLKVVHLSADFSEDGPYEENVVRLFQWVRSALPDVRIRMEQYIEQRNWFIIQHHEVVEDFWLAVDINDVSEWPARLEHWSIVRIEDIAPRDKDRLQKLLDTLPTSVHTVLVIVLAESDVTNGPLCFFLPDHVRTAGVLLSEQVEILENEVEDWLVLKSKRGLDVGWYGDTDELKGLGCIHQVSQSLSPILSHPEVTFFKTIMLEWFHP